MRARWQPACFRSDDRGSVLIEFALSISVLLTLIFGIVEFARALYAYHFLPFAAAEATRYGSVRGSTWAGTSCATVQGFACDATSGDVNAYVQSVAAPGLTPAAIHATTTWPGITPAGNACLSGTGANSPNCLVKVVVTYDFSFLLPFLPRTALRLSATSEKIIVE